MTPRKIRRGSPAELRIEWDDGHEGTYRLQSLRRHCPCAACKAGDDGLLRLPVLTPGQNDLVGAEAVGNYALQLVWRDGHRTGIYTYEYLRRLCECAACAGERPLHDTTGVL